MVKKIIKRYIKFFGGDILLAIFVGSVALTLILGVLAIIWTLHTEPIDENQYALFVQLIDKHKEMTIEVYKETLTIYLKNGDKYTFPNYFLTTYVKSKSRSAALANKIQNKNGKPLTVRDYMFLKFLGF